MGSAIPKADESIGWPMLPCCPYRHRVSTPCPPALAWLVLHFCPACDEPKRLYCRRHRDRHMPVLVAVPDEVALIGQAEHERRYEPGAER